MPEWGNLVGQGLDCLDFYHELRAKSQLFQEIGRDLALSLDRGQIFSETVKFFQKRIAAMIEYGEVDQSLEVS